MSFSGIVFDVDGTLLDTIEDLANSMNSVLHRHGLPEYATDSYKRFVGNGMRHLAVCALPEEERNPEKVDFYLAELENEYGKRWNESTRTYPGIYGLLDSLEKMEFKMFVLSNKPHQFTEKVIDHYFGLKRFEIVYGAREGVPKKPDPHSALDISRTSGIAVSDLLYLGDSEVDMKTAHAAGMYAVGAAWGFRNEEDLWSSGAQAVIKSPMELIAMINNLKNL